MAHLSIATEHGATLNDITRASLRDLVTIWRQTSPTDAPGTTSVLVDYVPDIITAYGDIAAVNAADYYDESRAAAGAPGRHRALPGAVASPEQVAAMVRYAVTPIWSTTPDPAAALARLSAGTDRLVRLADRRTIFDNATRDPFATGTIRVTRPDACGFCLLVASRGDHVRLTTAKPGRWHDNCKCGLAPSWGDRDDYPHPNDLYREFIDVTRGLSGPAARQEWDRHIRAKRT